MYHLKKLPQPIGPILILRGLTEGEIATRSVYSSIITSLDADAFKTFIISQDSDMLFTGHKDGIYDLKLTGTGQIATSKDRISPRLQSISKLCFT